MPWKVPPPLPWIPPLAVSSILDHTTVRLLLTVSHAHDSPSPAPSTHRSTSFIGDGTGLQICTVETPLAVAGVVASSPDARGVVDLSEGHG
ncbi:hypothetical protein E2562_000273 [Oryza meyeriana var. granulata]|uniref:Uncharacterized protein n=1 Tax=Oryza meyeriana var. granulata TaxID=110450 RepID=A0A6G1CMK8_9ORYZ|nr:hypothetical protein E2562_000273 [Oryza meyeriana var. granulata]